MLYCTLCKSKHFICRSFLILVLTSFLSRPRRNDVKKGVKNYHVSGANYTFLTRKCDFKISTINCFLKFALHMN